MNEHEGRVFDEIRRKFEAKDDLQALQELRGLANRVGDPWDRAWLNYQEIRFLVDMHNANEARHRLEELDRMLTSLVNADSPLDAAELDPNVTLPMLACHAEIRVTTEEGKEAEALQLLEGFVSRYPKQLSLPEFKALAEEVATLRGILLGNAGRWKDARRVLEAATPPEASKSQYCLYLGRCYYEDKEYKRARNRLLEALNLGLDAPTEGEAHYILGLVEYHLSDMRAAKWQFELSLKTADPSYLGEDIWVWLEATSRALGLHTEADNYQKIKTDSLPKTKTN